MPWTRSSRLWTPGWGGWGGNRRCEATRELGKSGEKRGGCSLMACQTSQRGIGAIPSHRTRSHMAAGVTGGTAHEAGNPAATALAVQTTKGPMWGHPMPVLGALGSFLEPFCGHLSPKLDMLCSKLTFEIPPRRALRGT